tara:strand:+ start:1927 stop:4059 length:2133 start_codon:yes stop_codon:yes gene_type:complete
MSLNIKFSDYSIDHIKDYVDNKLFLKLKRLDVDTIKDLLELDVDFFKNQRGVGENAVNLLIQLKEYIVKNEDRVLKYVQDKTKIISIPREVFDSNFLHQISSVVSTYCSFFKKTEHQSVVEKYYGISENKKLDYKDLGALFNYSAERVRQLRKKYLKEIQIFFENGVDEKKKIRINESLQNIILTIKEEFKDKGCIVLDDFKKYVKLNFNLVNVDKYNNEFYLLFDIIGFTPYGKLETSFTESSLLSTDLNTHKTFPKIGQIAIDFLKNKCIDISEEELIIKIKKSIGVFENYQIINFLKRLPEIEMFDKNRFQIKFHLLSRASDKAYRVLSLKGEEMYIDDIVNEINKEQSNHNLKLYNRESLTLPGDKRFKSFGKTGFWTLKDDVKSTEIIEKLIINALYRLDKPSSLKQIVNEVKKDRANVKESSVHILLSKICLKTLDNNYILKDWISKYPKLEIKEKRNKIKKPNPPAYRKKQLEDLVTYLEKKEENKEYASKIIKDLEFLDEKYTSQSFYKLFENENYFQKIMENKSLIVKLKGEIKVFEDQDVYEIINQGENSSCEFKETLRFCLKEQKKMDYVEEGVLKTIAAFLNTSGGDLFIGINDGKEIMGLDKDYQTFKEKDQNRDGFNKHLDNLIGKTFTNSIYPLLNIKIYEKDSLDFCRINVKPKLGDGIFVIFKGVEHFFIRRTGSTKSLTKKETIDYINNRKI